MPCDSETDPGVLVEPVDGGGRPRTTRAGLPPRWPGRWWCTTSGGAKFPESRRVPSLKRTMLIVRPSPTVEAQIDHVGSASQASPVQLVSCRRAAASAGVAVPSAACWWSGCSRCCRERRCPRSREGRPCPGGGRGGPSRCPAARRRRSDVEICLTTFPSIGLMKFSRSGRWRSLLSRQLTTSTTGYRTGSTPASFEPETRASEVPPAPQVGLTNACQPCRWNNRGVNAPPTWNWRAVHPGRVRGQGETAPSTPRRKLTATMPRLRTRVLLMAFTPGLW